MTTTRHRQRWPRAATACLAVGLVLLVTAAALLVGLSAGAESVRKVVPGAACTSADTTGVHGGEVYECVRKPGEDCPHWHWRYNPDVPHGTWSPRPAGPCPTMCSPTPPAGSPTASSPAPTMVAGSLPVTGPPLGLLVLAAVALITAGAVLLRVVLPRGNTIG